MIQTNLPGFRIQTENSFKRSSTTYTSPLLTEEHAAEKPTTASILSIFGGAMLALGGLYEASNVGTLSFFIGSTSYTLTDQDRTTFGTFGIIFGAVMIASGYMLQSHPEEHAPWGAVVLILSGLSIFTSLGGLIIGILLGGLGGIKAIRWKTQTMTWKSDNEVWDFYAEEVITEIDNIPGESERVFAIYEKSGLDGVVNALKQIDPDLSRTEATAVATRILAEIDLRRKRNAERQKSVVANEPTVQGKTIAGRTERETTTAPEEKKEKSWLDKWLKR